MSEIRTTKLQIRDVKSIINNIASTYKDFSRAAMEYIDNSIDSAYDELESGIEKQFCVKVIIDHDLKKLSIMDNCKGMSPDDLCGLVDNIGKSKKKKIPWVNGKFGFGVHAARAFTKSIKFYSQVSSGNGATIEIDRDIDEKTDIICSTTDYLDDLGIDHGTIVEISKFDPKVFTSKTIFKRLYGEIEKHFDDILRNGKIEIILLEKIKGKEITYIMKPFDYDSLEGLSIKRSINLESFKDETINVELKILDKSQKDKIVTIQNKGRRISDLVDLSSFMNFYKNNGKSINLWRNPYLIGFIEVNGICSPNLTRDDFKPGVIRDDIYHKLIELEPEIIKIIDDKLKNKNQDAFNKLGTMMSDYLNDYLRKFRFEFSQPITTLDEKDSEKNSEMNIANPYGDSKDGSELLDGKIWDKNERVQEPERKLQQKPEPDKIEEDEGGVPSIKTKGKETNNTKKLSGPIIKFRNNGPDQERVNNLIDTIEINTLHPDFIKRNEEDNGKIVLSERLINYVSIIIAPIIIQNLYVKEGQFPSNPQEVGDRNTNFIMGFEDYLIENANRMVMRVENV